MQLAAEMDFWQLDYLAVARVCAEDVHGHQASGNDWIGCWLKLLFR